MTYEELNIDPRFHRHIVGKSGANGMFGTSSYRSPDSGKRVFIVKKCRSLVHNSLYVLVPMMSCPHHMRALLSNNESYC